MNIRYEDLKKFADSSQGPGELPVLVRKLILETNNSVKKIRFPGGKSNNSPGLDGEVEAINENLWVPEGRSFWELSCNNDPRNKFKRDIGSEKGISTDIMKESTFVFVTPRQIYEKDKLIDEYKHKSDWNEIVIHEANDIELWLDNAPFSTIWLNEQLGINTAGIATPDKWWESWASASTPQVTKRLVASRRFNDSERLMNFLNEGASVSTVIGEDNQEAVAFVIATLFQCEASNEYLDRTWVINQKAELPAGYEDSNPILICDFKSGEDVDFGNREKITIIRTKSYGTSDNEYDPDLTSSENLTFSIRLSHVRQDVFIEELEIMGKDTEEAIRISSMAGNSIPVFRRSNSKDPNIRTPVWVKSGENAQMLIPFALAGKWDIDKRFNDQIIIQSLCDDQNINVENMSEKLLDFDNSPVVKHGSAYYFISQRESLFAICKKITSDSVLYFERFYKIAKQILSENDPALELPEEDRYMANLLGKDNKYSDKIVKGICDSLCILAIHGDKLLGNKINFGFKSHSGDLVRDILYDANSQRWYSCRDFLSKLAELSPEKFLDALYNDLSKPSPPIQSIIKAEENILAGECLRSDLLWALESLAWFPRYFSKVVEILLKLHQFEILDKWTNTPKETLESLFRVWLPSTTVEIDEKFRTLKKFESQYRTPIFDLYISLLPKRGSVIGTRTFRPIWRQIPGEIPIVTRGILIETVKRASNQLLSLGPYNLDELSKILKIADVLNSNDLIKFVKEIEKWKNSASESDIGNLRGKVKEFRSLLVRQRIIDKDNTKHDKLITKLIDIELKLKTDSLTIKHLWLFENKVIDWPLLVDDGCTEVPRMRELENLLESKQSDAISEIFSKEGMDGVIRFASKVDLPSSVAKVAVPKHTPVNEVTDWICKVVSAGSSPALNSFLAQILQMISTEEFVIVLDTIQKSNEFETDSVKFLLSNCLSNNPDGWDKVKVLGVENEEKYWKSKSFYIFPYYTVKEIEYVVSKLLEVKRPRAAFNAFQHSPERLDANYWVDILNAIIKGHENEVGFAHLDFNALNEIFELMDKDPNISDSQISKYEFCFAPIFFENFEIYSGLDFENDIQDRRIPALYREICRDPGTLIEIFTKLDPSDDQQKNITFSENAYYALSGWSVSTWLVCNNQLDEEKFANWKNNAYNLAEKHDKVTELDEKLGTIFGKFEKLCSEDKWLPDVIIDLLNSPNKNEMRKRFKISVYNSVGTTVRGVFDGGKIERDLADRYGRLSNRYENSHSEISDLLSEICEQFKSNSKLIDNRATTFERWNS